MWVLRWWRSSASASSVPSSASPRPSAKRLVGQALELRHRLPRLWRRVQAGDLPAWRARRVAETTIHADLSREAAAYVDAQLAPFAHRTSATAVDRLVDAAVARFDPARAAAEAARAADGRHVTIEEEQVSFAGTMRVTAELDLADALDLAAAVSQGAEQLKSLGSDETLDARRAAAVGEMARSQLSLPLPAETRTEGPSTSSRQVVLHVHLTEGDPVARLERGTLATLDQVQHWCTQSHTQVVVRPVLDLNEHITCAGYQPSPRLRDQVIPRDQRCVFPWCTRPARSCDLDHIVPWEQGGADHDGQPRRPLPATSPPQDPHRLDDMSAPAPRRTSGPARTATGSSPTPPAPTPVDRTSQPNAVARNTCAHTPAHLRLWCRGDPSDPGDRLRAARKREDHPRHAARARPTRCPALSR